MRLQPPTLACAELRRPVGVSAGPRAFTLIEMLLVVTIMSVMAGAVVVSFAGRRDAHHLQLAAEDLGAAIRFACGEAKTRQTLHQLRFDIGARGYHVLAAEPGRSDDLRPVRGQGGVRHGLDDQIAVLMLLADGASAPVPETLDFPASGAGFAGTLELRSRRGESAFVRVLPETGQVLVSY